MLGNPQMDMSVTRGPHIEPRLKVAKQTNVSLAVVWHHVISVMKNNILFSFSGKPQGQPKGPEN